MAKNPRSNNDDDDDDNGTAKPATKEDLKTEQEKAPENTQHEPYPTGGKIPERDVYGNVIEEK